MVAASNADASPPAAAPAKERWIGGDARTAPAAGLRLFCFAHAGGGASFFFPWRRALAPEVDVRPVVLPGREARARELPYRRIEQVIDPLCAAIEAHLDDRPYALLGHSLGAVIAYEVARRLTAGPPPDPTIVIVSGRRAPAMMSRRVPLSTLPDAEFLDALTSLNGTPSEVLGQPQLLRAFLPTLRADFELNESYRPLAGTQLFCPVAAYMGVADPEVDATELLAWHSVTHGSFTLRTFRGDHFYLKGGRSDVLSALRQDLDRGLTETGGAA